jgi:DNA-binding beta-propeller fold protein YncE
MKRRSQGRMGSFWALVGMLWAAAVPAAVANQPPPLERVQTIALKGPAGELDHLAVDSARGRLFVANTINGTLDVVDLKAGALLKQVPGQGKIHGVDYAPAADRIFAGVGEGGACNILDGGDYHLIKSVRLGDDADNLRYDPRTRRIYVVHADKELAVVDATDFRVRRPIPLSKDLGALRLEVGRPRLYLNAKEGHVAVIDTDKDEVIARHPVAPAGGNAALAIDERNRRLYVGCRQGPTLLVMDGDTGKIVGRVPIPGDVDDVSFDEQRGRIYASCGKGAIAVIERLGPDHYEALEPIPTATRARTSTFDPASGRLYLAVPRQADRPSQEDPEIWVYQARP